VPDAQEAYAARRKFTHYLLSESHPTGRAKARVFRSAGYDQTNWEELREGGHLYEAPMRIEGPRGTLDVQTIWEVHPDDGYNFRDGLSAITRRSRMAVAAEIPELAVVELTRDVDGHPAGAIGVVVSAHAEDDSYTVELVEASGRAADIIFTSGEDLRVTAVV
jgi:Domain of unknown function (DUF4926)